MTGQALLHTSPFERAATEAAQITHGTGHPRAGSTPARITPPWTCDLCSVALSRVQPALGRRVASAGPLQDGSTQTCGSLYRQRRHRPLPHLPCHRRRPCLRHRLHPHPRLHRLHRRHHRRRHHRRCLHRQLHRRRRHHHTESGSTSAASTFRVRSWTRTAASHAPTMRAAVLWWRCWSHMLPTEIDAVWVPATRFIR